MVKRINPKKKSQSAVNMISACIVLVLICTQILCSAAERSAIGTSKADAMLSDYFRAETAKLRDRCLTDIESLDDVCNVLQCTPGLPI